MSVHVMPLLSNMNAASAETASQQAARGGSSVPLCFGMPRLRLFASGTGIAAACMYRCRYKVGVTHCLACNMVVLPPGCHMAVRGTLHNLGPFKAQIYGFSEQHRMNCIIQS